MLAIHYWATNTGFIPLLLAVFFVLLHAANSQSPDLCTSKTTCGECIRTPNCSWCLLENYADQRCATQNIIHAKCPMEYEPLLRGHQQDIASKTSSADGAFSPQQIELMLSVGEKYRVNITYVERGNFPVDLYYLMDSSHSMADDKKKLSGMGVALHAAMRNITKEFRLGFGTFVDKVVMPYVSTTPEKLKAPCPNCAPPFGFQNNMKLNSDSSLFSKMVNESKSSGNLDDPEGGFDAIVQAIVCGEQIGWREGSRRLLLFSTDQSFHSAGDGKVGGIIKPNDGLCHLDADGFYTESSQQDYPSIAQINQLAQMHSVNIIFAVTSDQRDLYKSLTAFVEGSAFGELDQDSSNVVQLIADQYEKIRSQVEMKDNAPSHINVEYHSSCLGNTLEPTNKCTGLKEGDAITFEVEFSVKSCPDNSAEWQKPVKVKIYPVGLNESMTVNVNTMCQCDCEMPDPIKNRSDKCESGGAFQCGICYCDDEHLGSKCECSVTNMTAGIDLDHQCRDDQSPHACRDRGNCVCGKCQCEQDETGKERYSGKYCECDNFSCKTVNGKVCSENGVCGCNGQCKCDPDYDGDSCECPKSEDTCRTVPDGPVCSGRGECVCGKCDCSHTADGQFWGKFCGECLTCLDRCDDFRDCVLCMAYQQGPEACASNCSHVHLSVSTSTEKPVARADLRQRGCQYHFTDDCKYQFIYWEGDTPGQVEIVAQKGIECAEPLYIAFHVLCGIVGIIVLGLVGLLLWKLVTCLHDRYEYSRFEEERAYAMWDTSDNPLFKQPTTTFNNPTYTG